MDGLQAPRGGLDCAGGSLIPDFGTRTRFVRFGVVESINMTIKAVLRRARGMRDDQMLLLKLKWATVIKSMNTVKTMYLRIMFALV